MFLLLGAGGPSPLCVAVAYCYGVPILLYETSRAFLEHESAVCSDRDAAALLCHCAIVHETVTHLYIFRA